MLKLGKLAQVSLCTSDGLPESNKNIFYILVVFCAPQIRYKVVSSSSSSGVVFLDFGLEILVISRWPTHVLCFETLSLQTFGKKCKKYNC